MADWLVAYQGTLLLSALGAAGTGVYVYSKRGSRGAVSLTVVCAAAAFWAGSSFLKTTLLGLSAKILTDKVLLVVIGILVGALFLFSLQYTGRESWVTDRTIGGLAIEPLAIGLVGATNDSHQWLWTATPDPGAIGGVSYDVGLAFWLHTGYAYVLVTLAVFEIVVFAVRSKYLYQRQAAAIVVATLVPWASNVLYLLVGTPYDLTPVSFALTAIALTWATVRVDLLDITPVATELVLNTIDAAVFVVDDRDRVVELNAAASEMFDIRVDTAVGSSVGDLTGFGLDARSVYDELSAETDPMTRETSLGERYVRVQMSPLREHDGRLVGRAYIVVDLTQQRAREQELERRNEQLDRFAGVVSHDLRNPLEVASGSLQLARETGDPAYFERVERAHSRMDRLIEDILLLARQREESLDVADVGLATEARKAWEYVDTGGGTLEFDTDGLALRADPDRLGQLLENCFRNAIEHGTDGVVIEVGSLDRGPGFYIEDDGPGFGDANTDEVFEEGYTTSSEGTGFGLSIVREIASLHGWSVRASVGTLGGARIEVHTKTDRQPDS